MNQLRPDWTMQGTGAEIERAIGGDFRFSGPGFYLSETDTALVVPTGEIEPDITWRKDWPEEQQFDIYVYNCRSSHTIFSTIAVAPVRVDNRCL